MAICFLSDICHFPEKQSPVFGMLYRREFKLFHLGEFCDLFFSIFVVPNLEEDVAKLADKEGWITLTDFIKFALPTELCKVEFLDKYRKEEKEAKSSVKKERKKVRLLISGF